MNQLLIKIFIKDYKNLENNQVRNNYGRFTAVVGIVSNILLFIIKFILGIIFSSISVLADGWNNLIDSISSIITLFGFKLSAMPADREHPFGHARYESISGLLISIIVVYFGFEFLKASFTKILNPKPISLNGLMIFLLIVSILIKLWQYKFNEYVGKKIKSNVILATGIDSRNDVFITLLVLIGVIVEYFFEIKIDGYLGFILAIFIIVSGILMMRGTISELLGKRPSFERIKKMEDLLDTYQNIIGYHDLIVHQYGPNQCFATVHVEVDAKLTLSQVHEIVEEIEKDFLEKLDIDMVIHQDPVDLDSLVAKHYYDSVKAIIKKHFPNYSFHDFRIVEHKNYNKIIFDLVVDENENRKDKIIIEEVSEKIKQVFKTDIVDIVVDRNYLTTRSL